MEMFFSMISIVIRDKSLSPYSFIFLKVNLGHGSAEEEASGYGSFTMQRSFYSEERWAPHCFCKALVKKVDNVSSLSLLHYLRRGIAPVLSFFLRCSLALLPPSALIWVDGVAVAWQDTCLGPCVRRLAQSCCACFLCVTMSLPLSLLAPPSEPPSDPVHALVSWHVAGLFALASRPCERYILTTLGEGSS